MPQDSDCCQKLYHNNWHISHKSFSQLRSVSWSPFCGKKEYQDAKKPYTKEKD